MRSVGAGAIRLGWIKVQTHSAAGSGLLTCKDTQSGIEVGVEPVESRQQSALFVEESSDFGTGLTILKPDGTAEIELRIRDEAGNDPIGEVLTLGGVQQAALTLVLSHD